MQIQDNVQTLKLLIIKFLLLFFIQKTFLIDQSLKEHWFNGTQLKVMKNQVDKFDLSTRLRLVLCRNRSTSSINGFNKVKVLSGWLKELNLPSWPFLISLKLWKGHLCNYLILSKFMQPISLLHKFWWEIHAFMNSLSNFCII